jgi:hypothetical protein
MGSIEDIARKYGLRITEIKNIAGGRKDAVSHKGWRKKKKKKKKKKKMIRNSHTMMFLLIFVESVASHLV